LDEALILELIIFSKSLQEQIYSEKEKIGGKGFPKVLFVIQNRINASEAVDK